METTFRAKAARRPVSAKENEKKSGPRARTPTTRRISKWTRNRRDKLNQKASQNKKFGLGFECALFSIM